MIFVPVNKRACAGFTANPATFAIIGLYLFQDVTF